jgi:hypothetical protein
MTEVRNGILAKCSRRSTSIENPFKGVLPMSDAESPMEDHQVLGDVLVVDQDDW